MCVYIFSTHMAQIRTTVLHISTYSTNKTKRMYLTYCLYVIANAMLRFSSPREMKTEIGTSCMKPTNMKTHTLASCHNRMIYMNFVCKCIVLLDFFPTHTIMQQFTFTLVNIHCVIVIYVQMCVPLMRQL